MYQTFNIGFLGHDDALDQEVFDTEAARSLVTEAGAEGASLKIIQTQTSPQDQLALVFQQAAADIGLNVELVPISTAEARAEYAKGGYHGLSTVLIGQPEPSQTLNRELPRRHQPGAAAA